MKALVLFALALYRRGFSHLLPRVCRFAPSCSEYAAVAVLRHGVWHGSWQAMGRLLRCHPWHPGGYDPVR